MTRFAAHVRHKSFGTLIKLSEIAFARTMKHAGMRARVFIWQGTRVASPRGMEPQ